MISAFSESTRPGQNMSCSQRTCSIRRGWVVAGTMLLFLHAAAIAQNQENPSMNQSHPQPLAATQVAPGVWKIRLGTPEKITPTQAAEFPPANDRLQALPGCDACPVDPEGVSFKTSPRGCTIELPMGKDEHVFGFGLQMLSLEQTGKKRTLRVNSDPKTDTGDSHAPVPFYVTTNGYGVFVDTARYARFYCGTHGSTRRTATKSEARSKDAGQVEVNPDLLYKKKTASSATMGVDIPVAQGADVYVFGGPTMCNAVQRYNLFSGGGCVPPLWGLGVMYRGFGKFSADDALKLAAEMRERHIPCTMFGLEPGWQSHAYSCSYVWAKDRFPNPDDFVSKMRAQHYEINLWEHAYVHPSSPLHSSIAKAAGDIEVWGGLVPDFLTTNSKKAFSDYHETEFVKKGITGFKGDECDASDFNNSAWAFPEHSEFPSGADGEQMHSLLGVLYQQALLQPFRNTGTRTYGQIRSSQGLAAPYPFVLYSDLYDHKDFVRSLLTAGFSGLLWEPEVRSCGSVEELVRRVQTAVLAPQTVINSWFLANPPWKQVDRDKNVRGEFMPNWQDAETSCRQLLNLRMSLVPYLYSAFVKYHETGTPPVRALVLDWPDDAKTRGIDDEYMLGDQLLVAPIFTGQQERTVYLPAGGWFCFWTNQKYEGGREHTVRLPLDQIPIFVKEGAILPLAKPVEWIDKNTCFEVTAFTHGSPCKDFAVYEDDGVTTAFEQGAQNKVVLSWSPEAGGKLARTGKFEGTRYKVTDWKSSAPGSWLEQSRP